MGEKHHKCNECGFELNYKGPTINYCPKCGVLSSHGQRTCKDFLELVKIEDNLSDSIDLYKKNAYLEAARTAFIQLEEELKNLGDTNKYGYDLVEYVLGFDYDNSNDEFTSEPKVKINDLDDRLKRNEQDGIRQLVHGLFKGLRNIIMHNKTPLSPVNSITIIVLSNMVIDIINNGSIQNKRSCVWTKIDDDNSS